MTEKQDPRRIVRAEALDRSVLEIDRSIENPIDGCPVCKRAVLPTKLAAYTRADDSWGSTYSLWACPDNRCQAIFLAKHSFYSPDLRTHPLQLQYLIPNPQKPREFPKVVVSTSPRCVKIWNQATEAESCQLTEIAGMGYRKALEFLVKDYIISRTKDDEIEEKVKRMPLGQCIQQHLDDARTKQCAERAAWLGNDETHYVRLWDEKDITHLKTLIELVIHWMEAEALTEEFVQDMPDRPRKSKA